MSCKSHDFSICVHHTCLRFYFLASFKAHFYGCRISFLELPPVSHLICPMPLHGEEEGDAHTELTGSAHLRSHIGSLLPTTRQHRGSWEGTVRSNCQDRDDPVHGLLGGPSEICSGGWVRGVLGRSASILSPLFLPLGVLHFDLCCTTHI